MIAQKGEFQKQASRFRVLGRRVPIRSRKSKDPQQKDPPKRSPQIELGKTHVSLLANVGQSKPNPKRQTRAAVPAGQHVPLGAKYRAGS